MPQSDFSTQPWLRSGPVHEQSLRDAQFLVGSPSLLARSALLGHRVGQQAWGRRWWAALDWQDPALLSALQQCAEPAPARLGRYAEALMTVLLQHSAGLSLLAEHQQLYAGGNTLGELDYLCRCGGRTLHLELTVKYFLALPGPGELQLLGPDRRDGLLLRLQRLQQQLRLTQHPLWRSQYPDLCPDVTSAWARGMIFYPWGRPVPQHPCLAPQHARGHWLPVGAWAQLTAPAAWRFLSLPRLAWLGAAATAVVEAQGLSHAEMGRALAQGPLPQMVAVYRPLADAWLLQERVWVMPEGWGDLT